MLKKDPNYQKLKLGGAGLLSQSSFWLAADHLLVVEVSNYVERYRRFYFRDVQAIVIQESRTRWWWSVGFSTLLVLSLAALALTKFDTSRPDMIAMGIWLTVALGLGMALAINLWCGPTCVVLVRTAVQTQRLPNIRRRPRAEKLIDRLEPAINAAQTPAAPVVATTPDLPEASTP